MLVIDLYNEIAKGRFDELPDKIKVENFIFEKDDTNKDYIYEPEGIALEDFGFRVYQVEGGINLQKFLNLEIENIDKKENVLSLHYIEGYDDYKGSISYQELQDNDYGLNFSVSDLSECPEDACIGRDLFSIGNWVDTLNKGIELGKKGFDKIELIKDDEEEE